MRPARSTSCSPETRSSVRPRSRPEACPRTANRRRGHRGPSPRRANEPRARTPGWHAPWISPETAMIASETWIGPRERAAALGIEHLGDADLVAILLGTGAPGLPVAVLAAMLL